MINKLELQKAMLEADMSQRALAKAMHKSPNTVNQWVNGKAFPDINEVGLMCALLGITSAERVAQIFFDGSFRK